MSECPRDLAHGPHDDEAKFCSVCGKGLVDEWKGVYPTLCINPETCRGYSHCPRNYSCCE
jgi:hypothetical protein